VASNIKVSGKADYDNLMLSQFEDFPLGLEDLSLVASNIKVSGKADDENLRIFHLGARTLALWPLILRYVGRMIRQPHAQSIRGFSI
jgi:hypothetical protein